jgi:hypothetical protein
MDNFYHTGRMRGNWKETVSNAACATTFAHLLDPFTIPISFYLTKSCHHRFVKSGFWAEHCEPAIAKMPKILLGQFDNKWMNNLTKKYGLQTVVKSPKYKIKSASKK